MCGRISMSSLPKTLLTGLLIVKLPFPLTLGFKSMLQRGIETPDMDVRWVSSLSWYFLNFFGLNGLYRLILGGDNCQSHNCCKRKHMLNDIYFLLAADSSRDMTASPFASLAAQQPGQPQDFNKLFKAERDNLEFSEGMYSWVGNDVEDRVLRQYGKIAS